MTRSDYPPQGGEVTAPRVFPFGFRGVGSRRLH